jgi:hypothetical protein
MEVTNATIRTVSDLRARWAGVVSQGTVFSAAGAWPLLGFLAYGADGAARAELAEAVGFPAQEAVGRARDPGPRLRRPAGEPDAATADVRPTR